MQQDEQESSYLLKAWNSLFEAGTNLKYKLTQCTLQGLMGKEIENYFGQNDEVTMLGEIIKTKDEKNIALQNKYVLEIFSKIIWLTYRKDFDQMVGSSMKYTGDNGWGCMIRAGQMIYAEALRKFLYKEKAHQLETYQLIPIVFYDHEKSHMSIQNIVVEGRMHFNLHPGDWYTPNRICYVLKVLHEKKKKSESKHEDKLSKSIQQNEKHIWKDVIVQNLEIYNLNSDKPLVFEKLLKLFCGKNTGICTKHSDYNEMVYRQKTQINKSEQFFPPITCKKCNQSKKSAIIFISCKVGICKPQPNYLRVILKLLDSKYSIGMIGGRPKQALYFPGRINQNFIYLDPHYVQHGTNWQTGLNIKTYKTYFTNKLQTYPCSEIDSSLSLGFYLENLDELEDFHQQILRIQEQEKTQQSESGFFLWIERTKPYYIYDTDDEEIMNNQRSRIKRKLISDKVVVLEDEFSTIEQDSEILPEQENNMSFEQQEILYQENQQEEDKDKPVIIEQYHYDMIQRNEENRNLKELTMEQQIDYLRNRFNSQKFKLIDMNSMTNSSQLDQSNLSIISQKSTNDAKSKSLESSKISAIVNQENSSQKLEEEQYLNTDSEIVCDKEEQQQQGGDDLVLINSIENQEKLSQKNIYPEWDDKDDSAIQGQENQLQ